MRVLIKALLEEMERIKIKTGVQPEIDEGVIGMIRKEVLDLVDVDDILKVYRTVPKIVEVEKVIEQVVEKIVQVPHFVTIENTRNEIIPLNKAQVYNNTVNVPLQVPKYETLIQEKLVLAPEMHEKVVVSTAIEQNKFETVTEVPTVRQIDKVVNLMQDCLKVVEVPGPEKIVPLEKETFKTLIQEKIVPVEKVI